MYSVGELIGDSNNAVYHGTFEGERCLIKFGGASSDPEEFWSELHFAQQIGRVVSFTPKLLYHSNTENVIHKDKLFMGLLIFEYMPGRNIQDYIPSSEKELLSISIEMCNKLKLLHDKGYYHGDLADNVYLKINSDLDNEIYFIDFEFSGELESDDTYINQDIGELVINILLPMFARSLEWLLLWKLLQITTPGEGIRNEGKLVLKDNINLSDIIKLLETINN
jgi:serine/threonine protein kinase